MSGFAGSGPGVVFDTISLPPLGNEYIFLAKYDPAGVVQYVKQYAAGTGQDIHVLNNGSLYLNGGASKGSGHEFDDISLVYVDRGGFICQFSEAAAGGIPCEDLVSFQARCQSNGSAQRLQAKLTLTDTSHSGEQVIITVDGDPFNVTINGNQAQLSLNNPPPGEHTIELTDPAGCFPPRVPSCQ